MRSIARFTCVVFGLLLLLGRTAAADCYTYDAKGRCVGEVPTTAAASQKRASRRSVSTDEDGLTKFLEAVRDHRKPLKLPKDVFNYFDLNVEGICGPRGFASQADNYLAQAANYYLIKENRAIALTVTLSETGPGTTAEPQEIPLLVARPDQGKPTVDCSKSIRSGYNRSAVVKLKFNFYVSKKEYQVSPAVKKFTAFFAKLLSLDSRMFKIPSAVVSSAAATVFLGDLDKITDATNELLKDAFKKESDNSVAFDISEDQGGVAIPVGRKAQIRVVKAPRDTVLFTGPTYKGGPVMTAFKNVTGKDFAALTVNIDSSNLGQSASDDLRRRTCSAVRNIITQYVVGKDALLMMDQFITARADVLAANKGYNCLLPDEAKMLRDVLKAPEPYPGAYAQAISQQQPLQGEAHDIFLTLVDSLKGFAAQLKSVGFYQDLPQSNAKSALVKQAKSILMGYFDEQVTLDGAGREPLFPLSTQRYTDEEVADRILSWPKVTNFGCFLPVAREAGKPPQYILEALMRAETTPTPTIFHIEVNAVSKKNSAFIDQMWVTKLGTAKARFADKFKKGCGDKPPYWFPWKEMDDWTAEKRTAALTSAKPSTSSAHKN